MSIDREWIAQSTYTPAPVAPPTDTEREAAARHLAASRARERGDYARAAKLELSAQLSDPSAPIPAPVDVPPEEPSEWRTRSEKHHGFWCPKCQATTVYPDPTEALRGKCVRCLTPTKPGMSFEDTTYGASVGCGDGGDGQT